MADKTVTGIGARTGTFRLATPRAYAPISTAGYSIELRDKNGNLKSFLTPYISKVNWEWNRIGGCGACNLTINKPYRDITFDARDDIQIRVKSGNSSYSKLMYRGYIANATPTLSNDQSIQVQVRGYFDLFKKIVVQSGGDTKTYTNKEVSVIVNSIADTFIVPNTPIYKSTIDAGSFTCDTIQFLTTVDDALNTLSDLSGDVEYGVDEYLRFFWRTESTTIRKRFFVGNNIEMLERKVNYDTLVNRAYLVGGEVAGVKYKRTAENTDSQALYYLSEKIVNNGSIVTGTVADQYLGSILTENAQPQLAIRAKIANTDIRLEDTVPIGLIEFYDVDYDRDLTTDDMGDIIGETADGGSNITIGLTADGGDDIIIGGQFSAQVDRIQYEPSNTDNRMNLTIQFGDTVLETAAILKRLDLALANIQTY
jgi:hypothetical protein